MRRRILLFGAEQQRKNPQQERAARAVRQRKQRRPQLRAVVQSLEQALLCPLEEEEQEEQEREQEEQEREQQQPLLLHLHRLPTLMGLRLKLAPQHLTVLLLQTLMPPHRILFQRERPVQLPTVTVAALAVTLVYRTSLAMVKARV
jgi:hypothetical protein